MHEEVNKSWFKLMFLAPIDENSEDDDLKNVEKEKVKQFVPQQVKQVSSTPQQKENKS